MSTFKLIGRYEVKSEIARGGMATVFHAYDPRFERDVAIKVLPMAFLHDPQFRVRFEREAKMIALLEHPAIVPVYDFGEEGGQPYIVMRYMSGGSLTDRLKEGALSLAETAQLITRMAPAMDAAHARNIIHRDLKPGNILFDQYGNAYLSDFGIARIIVEGSATLTGEAILGTPAYMSPEQIQGEKNIDGRSDIYALGVLIYQMLCGQAPYVSDTPARVMMMHVLEPVPNIQSIRSDLPAGVEAVVSKAMAKDPKDRYSTAGELAADLEAIIHGSPLTISLGASPATMVHDRSNRSDFQMTTMMTPGKTVLGAHAGCRLGGSRSCTGQRVCRKATCVCFPLGSRGDRGSAVAALCRRLWSGSYRPAGQRSIGFPGRPHPGPNRDGNPISNCHQRAGGDHGNRRRRATLCHRTGYYTPPDYCCHN